MNTIFLILLFLSALFLILLVLVQRGKGGGLAGAFGGMGGQSAFGTKAGDLFTKVTIGVAFFWIVLCLAAVAATKPGQSRMKQNVGTNSAPIDDSSTGIDPKTEPAPEEGS
ncbi:MAG: preprotein translocase subunit SecG [Pirellulales bacterium]|nr:preprotein translocase subunit SecG [Pirellulales bacterium]